MLADSFTQTTFDMLSEAGEFEDPLTCYHRARGMEISGYGVDEEEGRLDLFLSIHTNAVPPRTVTRQQVAVAFRRLRSFLDWCASGKFFDLEESSPVFDMAAHIHSVRGELTQVRLCVITDGKTTVETLPKGKFGDVIVASSVWDVVRLHRLSISGQQRDVISIDFNEVFGGPLPCLEAGGARDGYRAFLLLMPGDVLRSVYSEFGSRLLETNVRSFLQARGKVNRGIRDTIAKEPERFLAYNNGITLTAESVELSDIEGNRAISALHGLQIVNGGQTTASLLATEMGKADLDQVHVAAKLIEIEVGDVHDELVRKVSRYANSQNRISEADFSSNHPFHVRIEEHSRTIWAPAAAGTQRQSKWFYERARGQYQVAKASESTPARRRAFAAEHPTRQRFGKTDLAKFENTWDQLPHIVSRGAQKNFSDFMIRHSNRDLVDVDRAHFERAVAKAILFRTAERIVQRQNFGGYRANIVTYTLSLLARSVSQQIDLARIWRNQALSDDLQLTIAELSHEVHRIITSPPSVQNITEWCKSSQCWQSVLSSASRSPVDRIRKELLDARSAKNERKRTMSDFPPDYVDNLKRIVEVKPFAWKLLADWAAETAALEPGQRQLAIRIGRAIERGREIKASDAAEAVGILDEAHSLGYAVDSEAIGPQKPSQ